LAAARRIKSGYLTVVVKHEGAGVELLSYENMTETIKQDAEKSKGKERGIRRLNLQALEEKSMNHHQAEYDRVNRENGVLDDR